MSFMNGGFYPSQYNYGQPMMRCRPVSSFDEARAAQSDFDGTVSVFPDIGHNRIYTKQIMLDGTAQIRTYALVEEPVAPPVPEYITKDEFNNTINEIRKTLSTWKEAQNDASSTKSSTVHAKPDDILSSF